MFIKIYQRFSLGLILLILPNLLNAGSSYQLGSMPSVLKHQQAANFTNMHWLEQPQSTINIQLLPLKNFSGIPMQKRFEKPDYYYHGKIPSDIQNLFFDLVIASRYFNPVSLESIRKNSTFDYQFQLIIERYQLPFEYAPDDILWKELKADVDRWHVEPKNATVKLSLKISSGQRHLSPWFQSITMTLSDCDLNRQPQPLTENESANNIIREYVKTSPGQTFIAASNYLILQAIQHISQQQRMAQVISNEHNELFIKSKDSHFKIGEQLALYYKPTGETQSALPVGNIEIIKTYQTQAVAFPIDIRVDQIKPGDWVEISETHPYQPPKFSFEKKNSCTNIAMVDESETEF